MTDQPPPSTPGRSLGGRFKEATDPLLERINRSIEIDQRMWREDIRGSVAHARMLASVELITAADLAELERGLTAVEGELAAGSFGFQDSDEDIHMAVERRLTELVGEPARRLHTGRSRNDQVVTDVQLWMQSALDQLAEDLTGFAKTMLRRAHEGTEVPMPAFTHSQPAQVSTLAQWLICHAAGIERHLRRTRDLRARLDECPLGSGAACGTYLPIDRDHTAKGLGFARPSLNALQTTTSRADMLDVLGLLALVGTDLSRLGEEMVLYAAPAYGWFRYPDRLTTGSSLLPQKRNPDGAELLRGGGKLAATEFAGLATVCGGLGSGYSKDLQYDKSLLFGAYDRTRDLLALATRYVDGMVWNAEQMSAACGPELVALWAADQLVLTGMAFRAAHHIVGEAATAAEEQGTTLPEALAAAISGDLPELAARMTAITPAELAAELKTAGSAGTASVAVQLTELASRLGGA